MLTNTAALADLALLVGGDSVRVDGVAAATAPAAVTAPGSVLPGRTGIAERTADRPGVGGAGAVAGWGDNALFPRTPVAGFRHSDAEPTGTDGEVETGDILVAALKVGDVGHMGDGERGEAERADGVVALGGGLSPSFARMKVRGPGDSR